VQPGGRTRRKLREWVRRYLLCEIAGTVGELGGAAVVYLVTGSLAAAAIAATIGASVGYYAAAYISAVRWSYRDLDHRRWLPRLVVANLLALRSVAVEFGPAELIDGIAVRPVAFYVGPLIFDNTIAGWIFGKLVSDFAFYLCAISSYERFKSLLVRAEPHAEEVADESVAAIEAA
jgi:putative flippase GtrA